MQEQLVSFETANLAREKGFDEDCTYVFNTELIRVCYVNELYLEARNSDKKGTTIPTQTLLQDWLREKHNIHIEILIDRTTYPKFCYKIFKYKHFGDWKQLNEWPEGFLYSKPEECLENALREALKFIEL